MVHSQNLRPEHYRLIRKLESISAISEEDKSALLQLPLRVKDIPEDQDIVREGDRPSECCLILDGFVSRYKMMASGKRQILSFHTPGDMPDLQSLHIHVMDHSLGTLVPTRVAFIPHREMLELCRRYPSVAAAFWRDALIDAAIFREWIANIGRRNAYQRLAHIFCELEMRLAAVGLSKDHSYDLPLTQEEIGDAQGLTTVHVNRTLKQLRENGLITFERSKITIRNWEGLQAAGEFSPAYLHLRREAG